jgi:hypothetical protein
MTDLFVIAGVPASYVGYINPQIRKRIASETGELLIEPLPHGVMAPVYDPGYRHQLIRACAEWVRRRVLDDQFSISLLYARKANQEVTALVEDFFPFAFTRPFQPPQIEFKPNLIAREVNALAERLKADCIILRNQAKIILEHLSSRVRRTPLLLPPKNFGDERLMQMLRGLQVRPHDGTPFETVISNVIREFDKTATRQKRRSEGHHAEALHYTNSDGLVFVSPPNNQMHANAHPEGERPSCILRGRARLGGSYNPRFHYDCEPSSGALKAEYLSCHDQPVSVGSSEYVNIAPNEHIRPG